MKFLYVGIMSYPSPAALVRRNWQRTLCNASSPNVRLHFIMGAADVDLNRSDVLVFDVARNDRLMGTYLLTNRFFRYALAREDAAFIARADDDAAFNTGNIAQLLFGPNSGEPWASSEHIVFGPFGEWYMWNREAMQPSCFAYYSFRWFKAMENFKAKQVAAERSRNASSVPLARWQHECVHPGLSGPFPYAKGPFVAYSRAVVTLIVRSFAADEAYALSRGRGPLADVYGTVRQASDKQHPAHKIVYDDVYYSSLVFEAYRDRALTLIRAPLSEYVKERASRLQPALVYHKLKHPMRFSYVLNHSDELLAGSSGWGHARCDGRPGWARALSEYNLDCCERWVGCEWRRFHKWIDMPPRRKSQMM
jgi:hypothetical protein